MRKGILFSTDAALALVVVIILAGWITVQFNAAEEKGAAFESLHSKALDRAIMASYGSGTSNPGIDDDAEFGQCVVFYTLDPDNGAGRADVPPFFEDQIFCEELP